MSKLKRGSGHTPSMDGKVHKSEFAAAVYPSKCDAPDTKFTNLVTRKTDARHG